MIGDYFVMILMSLNAGAAITYGWQGQWWKCVYWVSACVLNLCILKLR